MEKRGTGVGLASNAETSVPAAGAVGAGESLQKKGFVVTLVVGIAELGVPKMPFAEETGHISDFTQDLGDGDFLCIHS